MMTMRAIVLDGPGPPAALQLREVPVPKARPGWVLLRVEAFGLNRSELHTRLGLAGTDVTFPRVLGIEAAGIIEAAPETDLPVGSKAVAMVGGMGRSFDGGYAEYTLVPASSVVPVETALDWAGLGALPEGIVEEFYPIDYIPTGVRLTAYGGDASNLPGEVLSEIANAIHSGEVDWPVEVYSMDEIERAHDDMEHNRVTAKQVVLTRPPK